MRVAALAVALIASACSTGESVSTQTTGRYAPPSTTSVTETTAPPEPVSTEDEPPADGEYALTDIGAESTDCSLAFNSDLESGDAAEEDIEPDSVEWRVAAVAFADLSLTECSTVDEFVSAVQTGFSGGGMRQLEDLELEYMEYLANVWLGYSCKIRGEGRDICQTITSKQRCVAEFMEAGIEIEIALLALGVSSVGDSDEAIGEAATIFATGMDECATPEVWDQTIADSIAFAVDTTFFDTLTPTYETLCSIVEPAPELCSLRNT